MFFASVIVMSLIAVMNSCFAFGVAISAARFNRNSRSLVSEPKLHISNLHGFSLLILMMDICL